MPSPQRLLAIAALASTAAAQTLEWTFTGVAGDDYGTAVLAIPDQNGDGFHDVLVGAPGNNSDRGMIRCISGKFMATGSGTVVLWSLHPATNAGGRFGTSLANVGPTSRTSARA